MFFPTSKPLNILHGALFLVCFLLNTLFLLFCGFLTCNCISCAYLVAVQTINTQSTPYCLFLTAENVTLTFGFVFWLWKKHAHLFSNFETSKYLRWRLFIVYFVLNTLFLLFCGFLSCNCISCAYPFSVYTVNTPRTGYCWFSTPENVPSIFDAMMSTSQHKPYHFSILQTSKYVRRHLVCCLFVSKCVFCFDLRHFNK